MQNGVKLYMFLGLLLNSMPNGIVYHLMFLGLNIKCLWSVGGKDRGSNLQEETSHTYTLRLG